MPIAKKKAEKGLKKKGFRRDNKKHRFFIYWTLDNLKTSVSTHTSHGGKKYKELSEDLVHEMAAQCHLDKRDFIRLIECPMDQEEYEAFLKKDKAI